MKNIRTEDYIKAIYKLDSRMERVSTSALAGELKVADASITSMIKKLSERGFVSYEPYRGVGLTKLGRRTALRIIRRHRLWEMFLVQYLGYSWDRVHDEAERLEHVMSDEMEERLDKALGHPTHDPHGDPIPTVEGKISGRSEASLFECEVGDIVKISRVDDDDSDLLLHASGIGLTLNGWLTVKEKKKFDGSMVVRVGDKQQFISRKVASAVFVEKK
jgi:DtxR family Mn-dependent transcriptional regulator